MTGRRARGRAGLAERAGRAGVLLAAQRLRLRLRVERRLEPLRCIRAPRPSRPHSLPLSGRRAAGQRARPSNPSLLPRALSHAGRSRANETLYAPVDTLKCKVEECLYTGGNKPMCSMTLVGARRLRYVCPCPDPELRDAHKELPGRRQQYVPLEQCDKGWHVAIVEELARRRRAL